MLKSWCKVITLWGRMCSIKRLAGQGGHFFRTQFHKVQGRKPQQQFKGRTLEPSFMLF